jgi:hypothetical protein
MQCETVHAQLSDHLSGALSEAASEEIRRHLDDCPACRAEAESFAATWRMLGSIEPPAPDSDRMRARFDAVIEAFEDAQATPRRHHFRPSVLQGLTAAALVVIGIAIGHYAVPVRGTFQGIRPVEPSSEIAAMRGELHDLREMVTLSLMQEQSASERLKGVSWSGQIDRPSSDIVAALLDTLMHDPNVNVRLATIDALERFASQDVVRRGTIQAVDQQMSPLVQIALIDFMVKVNERESIGALRRLSQDPRVNAAVRERAAWGVQQLG